MRRTAIQTEPIRRNILRTPLCIQPSDPSTALPSCYQSERPCLKWMAKGGRGIGRFQAKPQVMEEREQPVPVSKETGSLYLACDKYQADFISASVVRAAFTASSLSASV